MKKETDIDEAVLLRLIALRDCRRFLTDRQQKKNN